jgi:hypothetical protein
VRNDAPLLDRLIELRRNQRQLASMRRTNRELIRHLGRAVSSLDHALPIKDPIEKYVPAEGITSFSARLLDLAATVKAAEKALDKELGITDDAADDLDRDPAAEPAP